MKVYILDTQSRSRDQMLTWLSENKRVTGIQAFEDYICFINQVEKSPPDFCIIRLGSDEIPGLKTAVMTKNICTDIRIIFIADDRDYAIDAYEVGAYGYLLCPIMRYKLEKYMILEKGL